MKRLLLILTLLALAPTIIDQSDSDFNQGTPTNINITVGQLELAQSSGNYTTTGTYVSQIFDLSTNPSGNISWTSTAPSATSILVSTRSAPSSSGPWSSWSSNYADPTGSQMTHPMNRYVQYRVQLTTTNQTITPSVQAVQIDYENNNAPVLASITNKSAIEGEELAFTVTASDADSDILSYSTTHGTITKFTNTQADFEWTPQGANVGLTNVTITVSDGQLTDQKTFRVNTTASNKQPTIRPIADITAYYGQRVVINVIVDDNNQDENLTFSSTPFLPLQKITTNASTTYTARANFSVFDDQKGSTQYVVTARDDDGLQDTENFTLTVNYCGDNVCQSQESAESCSQDCVGTQEQQKSYIAVEFPDRICANQTINITAYNASSRYECFLDGKTTESSAAWCDVLDGADFQFYGLNGSVRTDLGTASTNEQGTAAFAITNEGRYRLIASAEGYVGTEETFTARVCNNDIANQQQIVRTSAPNIELEQRPPSSPRPERPEITPENASILSIIIWYMFVPLLLASLIYVSNEYYVMYKDTDPKILALRIKTQELKQQYWPKIEPYWIRVRDTLQPILAPAWAFVYTKAILPVWKQLEPIVRKLSKR